MVNYNAVRQARSLVVATLISSVAGQLMVICFPLRYIFCFLGHRTVKIEFRPYLSAGSKRGETMRQNEKERFRCRK